MANTSNNFLKGKMNKDLDARLLQNGEYRNAINASISKSEGANVGAMENVLGNSLAVDFNTLTGKTNLKSIGYLTDEINNTVYLFLTNNATAPYNIVNNDHFIISYNSLQGPTSAVILVQGAFLNFSQLNPIYGVSILEGLLFWTDNRNQPRKINVVSAGSNGYYKSEDQISVAKYNPYESIQLFQEITSAMVTANPLLGTAVGKYQTTMFDVSSKAYPNGGSATSTNVNPLVTANSATTPILINANTAQGDANAGDKVYYIDTEGVLIDTGKTVATPPTIAVPSFTTDADITAYDEATFKLVFVFNANPYYEDNFSGDSEFLKDKFVRFSYRFQFDDNEYSIFAPFTQPAFIPEQDGYFLYNKDWTSTTTNVTDEEDTYRSTIVDFMENKVTKIQLRIPLPARRKDLFALFKVTSIDILYKESDALAVKVVDTIQRATWEADTSTTPLDMLFYEYNSKKPFKTLPSDEITRVFDKVPVRAFSQEISANRIIYGNFQTKHTPPETIDYSVNVGEKEDNTGDTNPVILPTAIESKVGKLEYPSSTLKQNRTYQVGIVLSDKFGRQSTVVLSNQDTTVQSGGSDFGGSTTFTGYLDETVDKVSFPGNALRVLFNQPIGPDTPNASTGWPGIYNDTVGSALYNPLGWYSYKIVVKQQEQEYYNVYLPGVLAAYPDDKTLEIGKTSHTVLINDNINKVPRDLVEVGPTQKQFRSSVDLNGRVENLDRSPTQARLTNQQFYPTKAGDVVSTIASDDDLFNGENTQVNFIPSQAFYSIDSNPFIARISTTKQFGVTNDNVTRLTTPQTTPDSESIQLNTNGQTGTIAVGDTVTGGTIVPGTIVTVITDNANIVVNKKQTLVASTRLNFHKGTPIRNLQNLAVFETDPVVSELDIFWETSSSGLIADLNQAIIDDSAASASISGFNSNNFTEAIVPGYSAPPTSSLTTAGLAYDATPFTVTGGTGTGLIGTIDSITGGGATGPIATYTITNQGNGAYAVNDVLTIVQAGASGGTITISAVNVNPVLGAGDFKIVNQANVVYNYGNLENQGILTLVSVFDTRSPAQDRSAEFVLNDNNTQQAVGASNPGVYSVGVKGDVNNPYYYYGFPLEARSFRFLFRTVVNSIVQEFYEDVDLINVIPSITGCPGSAVTPTGGNGTAFSPIATLYAVNGSAYGLNKQTDLTWTLTEAAGDNYFNISTSVVNNYPTAGNNALKAVITVNGFGGDPPNRNYTLRAVAKDAGNLSAACIFIVTINVAVCQFVQSSAANPTPDYDPTVAGQANSQGNQIQFKADWKDCTDAAQTITLDADGIVFCRQILGSSIEWELLLPNANIPVADRTGVFNSVVSSCGGGGGINP